METFLTFCGVIGVVCFLMMIGLGVSDYLSEYAKWIKVQTDIEKQKLSRDIKLNTVDLRPQQEKIDTGWVVKILKDRLQMARENDTQDNVVKSPVVKELETLIKVLSK